MARLVIHGLVLACGIIAAVGIWRSAFEQQVLSKREAVVGAPASIVCAALIIYMGAARNPRVLPLILVLFAVIAYIVAKALRTTYVREKGRRG